jgi:hypothetical protein
MGTRWRKWDLACKKACQENKDVEIRELYYAGAALRVVGFLEAVLVHDPIGLLPVRGAAAVEDERLAHADLAVAGADALVPARRLPEPDRRGAVRPRPRRVLAVLVAEEVPLVLRRRSDPAPLCIRRPCQLYIVPAKQDIHQQHKEKEQHGQHQPIREDTSTTQREHKYSHRELVS